MMNVNRRRNEGKEIKGESKAALEKGKKERERERASEREKEKEGKVTKINHKRNQIEIMERRKGEQFEEIYKKI